MATSGSGTGAPFQGVPVPKILGSSNPATHVLLALTVQIGGLIVVTILAGLNDSAGNMLIFLMLALILLFAIMNANKFSGISNIITNAEQGA